MRVLIGEEQWHVLHASQPQSDLNRPLTNPIQCIHFPCDVYSPEFEAGLNDLEL